MSRPRETDKRRELGMRAVAVLEREGLTISAEELARHLDVKRPTLLYHFPNYASIIQTVLVEILIEQMAFVAAAVEEHEHPIDRLYARLCAIHEFHRGRESRLLFLSQALAVTGGAAVKDILKNASALFAADRADMVGRVEQGVVEGIVHPCDASALIALLRAIIDGLTIQTVTSDEPTDAIYAFVWERVLEPLKREPAKPRRPRSPRTDGRAPRTDDRN